MTNEEQRNRVRNILQDFYRRDEYELEQATDDVMRLIPSLPPAEGAEAIVKKYEDEYDFKFHWVQRDRVIRMMREFAAQPQPKLDPKKVQWSGYGELGNISQKPLQPTAEGAEANRASIDDLIKKHIPIDAANFEYCAKHNIINGGLLQGIRDVVNSFMKPQPTAEGAEEILAKARDFYEYQLHDSTSVVGRLDKDEIIDLMSAFATLHAQRIADKMVEERLKEDTYMTCDVCGCHPSVIITTSFGKFCQQHAKYI